MHWQLEYEWTKATERMMMWIAWHTPRWLVYWCTIRAYSHAWKIAGNKEPDELTYREVADAAHSC